MRHEHLFQLHPAGPRPRLSGCDNPDIWRMTLASCLINGKPGVAIVLVDHVGEGKVAVMSLFVAITEDMDVVFQKYVRRR